MTLVSCTGPYLAEKAAFAGHSPVGLAAILSFCLVIVIVLPLLEAAPAMVAALYEHVIDMPLALAVALSSIGLVLLLPVTVTGSPFASLTLEL